MRVLLITPNIRPVEIERGYNVKPRQTAPAFGLLSIAGLLKANGHHVSYYDPSLEDNMETAEQEIKILAPEFDAFGVSTTGFTIQYDAKAMEIIRKKNTDAIIVAGGYFATFRPDETLQYTEADIVTMGESELAFLKIADVLESEGFGHPLNTDATQALAGYGVLAECEGSIYGDRKPITLSSNELNNLPIPAWDLVDMDAYEKHWNCRFIPYSTSRGCNKCCTFCIITEFCKSSVRGVMPEKVITDLTAAVKAIHPGHVAFSDPNFTADPEKAEKIIKAIKDARDNSILPDDMEFGCQSRVDTITPGLLDLMKEAGFEEIWYGFESGSQRVLREFSKYNSVSDNLRAVKETANRGIIPVGFMIMASSESTVMDILETLEFIVFLKENGGTISPDSSYWVTPFMGTKQIQDIGKKSSKSVIYKQIILAQGKSIEYVKEGFAVYPENEHARYIITSAYKNLQKIGTATPHTRIEALFRGFFEYLYNYPDHELTERLSALYKKYCLSFTPSL